VKIPQVAVRDTTGSPIPGYFNIWNWILPQLTASERGASWTICLFGQNVIRDRRIVSYHSIKDVIERYLCLGVARFAGIDHPLGIA